MKGLRKQAVIWERSSYKNRGELTDLLPSEEEGVALFIIAEKERRTSPTGFTPYYQKSLVNFTEMHPQEMKIFFYGTV